MLIRSTIVGHNCQTTRHHEAGGGWRHTRHVAREKIERKRDQREGGSRSTKSTHDNPTSKLNVSSIPLDSILQDRTEDMSTTWALVQLIASSTIYHFQWKVHLGYLNFIKMKQMEKKGMYKNIKRTKPITKQLQHISYEQTSYTTRTLKKLKCPSTKIIATTI